MSQRETDLDRITTLLGQCLGRIDEQAFRLQRDEEALEVDDAVLEQEAATLQELVGSLIDADETIAEADLNRIVDRAVRDCLAQHKVPAVVRQRLAPKLPPIACGPGQLAFAVQRAVMLGLSHLDPGGDLVLTTREDDGMVVFEMECSGHRGERHFAERAASLCEFVTGFQATCRIATDERGQLLLVLELPTTLPVDGAS